MSEVWASDELIRQTKAGVELWRPVVGSDGWYDVSNMGQVRTWIKRGCRQRTRMEQPRPLSATLNRPADQSPYLCVTIIREDGRKRFATLHVLMLEAFAGPKPDASWDGGHHDGDYRNNRLDNVRWCTKQVNYSEDQKRLGRTTLKECREIDGVNHYRCTGCESWKPETEFGRMPEGHPGAVTLVLAKCLPCARERGRLYAARRRAKAKGGV
jgi:hypothetical protein